MHHWIDIMANASCHMHHFILRMEHPVMALHQHCNRPSRGCIIIMVSNICTWSWKILSLSLDILALHWHKQACFATSILQLNPIIKSWARMFQKSSPKPFFVLSSIVFANLVLNLTDIRFLHLVISALWELATLHYCRSSFLLTFSFWIWKSYMAYLSNLVEEPCKNQVWVFA